MSHHTLGLGLLHQQCGDLICTRHWPDGDERGYLTIDQADPHIMVTDDLLHSITKAPRGPSDYDFYLEPPTGAAPPVPWAQWHDHDLDADPWPCQPYLTTPDNRYRCWHNWLLHISGRNRKVIYRIRTYDLQHHAWSASWPD